MMPQTKVTMLVEAVCIDGGWVGGAGDEEDGEKKLAGGRSKDMLSGSEWACKSGEVFLWGSEIASIVTRVCW